MKSLTSSLTKHFIIAGFLPALIFTVINRALFAIALSTQAQEAFNKVFSPLATELEGFPLILISVVIGALLMSCNTVLIRLYEGYYFRRLLLPLSRQRSSWSKTYKRLVRLHAKLEEMEKESATGREANLRYESVVRAIFEEETRIWGPSGRGWYTPFEECRLMPTRLGNAFAVMEEYPFRRYNMDATFYWPRMLSVIPEKYDDEIGNLKMSIDFALNLSALLHLTGVEFVAVTIIRRNWYFVIGTVVALAFGYLLYSCAVLWAQEMGTLVASCFDLFREDLKKHMMIDSESTLEEEGKVWLSLAQFLVSADTRHLKKRGHGSMRTDLPMIDSNPDEFEN